MTEQSLHQIRLSAGGQMGRRRRHNTNQAAQPGTIMEAAQPKSIVEAALPESIVEATPPGGAAQIRAVVGGPSRRKGVPVNVTGTTCSLRGLGF